MVIWGCQINMTLSSIDKLKLYFGEPYVIHTSGEDIIIHQPTIGDIVDVGESKVYAVVNVFVANSTMYRVQLWDSGIDWNKVSDFQMFCMLVPNLSVQDTRLLFGDIDFSKFELYKKQLPDQEEPSIILFNKEQNIEIDENVYAELSSYIKLLFNVYPKVEKAKGKTTKEWIIEEEKQKLKRDKEESEQSTLLPMISACLNHPGFKYKKNELREVGLIEFMDSVQRLQIYESTTALLKGMYSGFIDTSKIKSEEFNFMREIKYKK